MARNPFKSLSEYLKTSQKEWYAPSPAQEDSFEQERQAQYEIGMQAFLESAYDDAIPCLKKATGSKVYRKDAYYYLAECYQRANMIPLARKTYERLMRIDYHFKDVQERIRALDTPGALHHPSHQSLPTQQSLVSGATPVVTLAEQERYEILTTLHEGKQSRIYKVRDTLLERVIALKQIDPKRVEANAFYFQQLKERTAVTHPAIVRIYDIDESQGRIAIDYVEGCNLRYTLRMKGALAPKMALHLAIQMVNGLHHAHLHNILHYAFTPEHLLLTRQCHLKIIAFRALDSFLSLRKTDDPYKYLYIPPELFRERDFTVASNVYSLGVILYEVLSGKTPFRLSAIKAFIHHQTPLKYDETCLPPGLSPILRRCLAVNPHDRFSTVHAVGEGLIAWFKGFQRDEAHDDDLDTYKDYLLMAWADGNITPEEAEFLAHKRQELHITNAEAATAEVDVKQELQELLREA